MSFRSSLGRWFPCCRPREIDDDTWRRRDQLRRREARFDLDALNRHHRRYGLAASPRPSALRTQSDSILSARPTRLQALAAVHLPTGVLVPPPALARVRETEEVRTVYVRSLPSPLPRRSPRSPLARPPSESPEGSNSYFPETR